MICPAPPQTETGLKETTWNLLGTTAASRKPISAPDESSDTEFLLSALRVATLRAKLAANELDSVGVALRNKLVTYDDALAWLCDVDLLEHIPFGPVGGAL
jgi:hypothetical protein